MIAKLIMLYLRKHGDCITVGNHEIRLLYMSEYKSRDEWYEIFETENRFAQREQKG